MSRPRPRAVPNGAGASAAARKHHGEYAAAFGSFPSSDAAIEHLHRHHANPGGYSILPLDPGEAKADLEKDPVLKQLIADAPSRMRGLSGGGWR